jgi:hypothetical protein
MGTGRINIWITEEGDPCRISKKTWSVVIWDCCGRVVEWCDKRYAHLEAKCGHLEVELPPGKYVIRGAKTTRDTEDGVKGNHWTDHGIVTVCCDMHPCITLYAPTAHNCGVGFLTVLKELHKLNALPINNVEPAINAIQEILPLLPKTAFDVADDEMIKEWVKRGCRKEGNRKH